MKKLVLFVIILVAFSSCYMPKYAHSGNVTTSLDFSKGKWLLNDITAPSQIKETLTKVTNESFTELLDNRFSTIRNTKGIIFPDVIETIDKQTLKDIKNGTNFDFFITIKAKIIFDEFGDILTFGNNSSMKNAVNIELKIYDLNLLEEFYTHSVNASVTIIENNKDLAFAKGTSNLLTKSLKRIFKKMKKNQIRN